MRISILTLFPEMFSIFDHSIIGRAREKDLVNLEYYNIRDYSLNKHKKVDDYPYGGGAGMVMTPQPIIDSIKAAKEKNSGKVIFLGPRGKTFNQEMAQELSKEENKGKLVFYAGMDKVRFKKQVVPGDQLVMTAKFVKRRATIAVVDAKAEVDGKLAASGTLTFAIGS